MRARVTDHRDAADGAIASSRENLFAFFAVIADEMRWLMVARTTFEKTRWHRSRLEVPLLAAVVTAGRDEKRLTGDKLDASYRAIVGILDRVSESGSIVG